MTDPRYGKSSASTLGLVCKCQGYLRLWNSIKDKGSGGFKPDTPDSVFGTQVHAAWAGNLSELSLSEKQQLVKKKADSIRAKLIRDTFGDEPISQFAETRFHLFDKNREVIHSAQIDWAGHRDGKWLVLDLKSLYGDQEPSDENWQLLSQAVCIGDDDAVRNMNGQAEIKEITCGIVQPLVTATPDLVKYTAHDLARAKVMILRKLDEAQTPEAPRTPGQHCKYCPVSSHCPESAADLMALDKRKSFELDSLTPEMVAQILPKLPALKKRIKDFEDRAKSLAEGGNLPGYEIKHQEGARYIQSQKSVQSVREAIAEYVTKEELLPLLSLPFGELREVFIEKVIAKDRCDKVAAGKLYDKIVGPLCQREKPKKLLSNSLPNPSA